MHQFLGYFMLRKCSCLVWCCINVLAVESSGVKQTVLLWRRQLLYCVRGVGRPQRAVVLKAAFARRAELPAALHPRGSYADYCYVIQSLAHLVHNPLTFVQRFRLCTDRWKFVFDTSSFWTMPSLNLYTDSKSLTLKCSFLYGSWRPIVRFC